MKTYDFLLREAFDAYLLNGNDIKKACNLITQINAKIWERRLVEGLQILLKESPYIPIQVNYLINSVNGEMIFTKKKNKT
jgi:hypothetical protein